MTNGEPIIKVGSKGRRVFQFHDDDDPDMVRIKIDVIAAQNEWAEICAPFANEQGEIPKEKHGEMNQKLWEWVRGLIIHAGPTDGRAKPASEKIDLAQANEFLTLLTDECKRLAPFFVSKLPSEQSSLGSSAPPISFTD